jgi:peptidoglycan hydrolase-like protein with peptidoglycan-binding domain
MHKKLVLFIFSVMLLGTAFIFSGFTPPASAAPVENKSVTANDAVILATCPTLSQGSKGSYVKILQRKLNAKFKAGAFSNSPNDFKPPLKEDGDFGSLTRNAVIDYQFWNPPLQVDGIVGEQTWKSLGGCK